jgi:hypothetical protein
MKTTIDLPDPIFRRAKATAAVRGITLKTFISNAVEQSLGTEQKDWRAALKNLPRVDKKTTDEIMSRVAEWDEIDLEFQRQEMKANK